MAKPAAKAFITSKASGERLPIKGHINQMGKKKKKNNRPEVDGEYSNLWPKSHCKRRVSRTALAQVASMPRKMRQERNMTAIVSPKIRTAISEK